MRILAFNDEPLIGGAAQLFRRTNEILRDGGHDVVTITGEDLEPRRAAADPAPGGWRRLARDVSRVPSELRANVRQLYYPALERAVDRVLREGAVDVAHVHNIHGRLSTYVFSILRRRGIPVVYQVNDYYFFCNTYYAYNPALDAPCKRCIHGNVWPAVRFGCVGAMAPNRLGRAWPQAARRVALNLLRPWRHVQLFLVTSDQAAALLEEWGISPDRQWKIFNPVRMKDVDATVSLGDEVVFYGQCLANKGSETFARALDHVTPGSRLGVYLMGMTPEYEARIRAAARRRGLQVRVDGSLRWHTGLRERVAAARAVVVPSQWWVTSENVVYESLLLGKPVIVSRIGGNVELVEHEETGFLFQARNDQELAGYINRLAQDSKLAGRMALEGQRRARIRFAESGFRTRLETAYLTAITGRRAAGESSEPS